MKICTVIGARPQFIKAAAVSTAIARQSGMEELIIHTGQHYDPEMSAIFFDELKIPKEKYNLEAGSGSHGSQTAKMLVEVEKVLIAEKPDIVLVYGDTNSTLAGALAAVKLHIPVAHVEAGMRSFNKAMPEEINRILTDHIAALNFCSTTVALENLRKEGREKTAFLSGDVMYDCALMFADVAEKHCDPLSKLGLHRDSYVLMTCHRAENTNDPARLSAIVEAVNRISDKIRILYPLHPRTKKYLDDYGLEFSSAVQIISPLSYLEMILLEKSAAMIFTDSGGVQKEAFFYKVPCVTMRDETEWVETVESGWNKLTGADMGKIVSAFEDFCARKPQKSSFSPYGNGGAAAKITDIIMKFPNV